MAPRCGRNRLRPAGKLARKLRRVGEPANLPNPFEHEEDADADADDGEAGGLSIDRHVSAR